MVVPRTFAGVESRRVMMVLAVLILAAALAGFGISKYPFWDDEAETALFARNIVTLGSRTAWDGSNLAAYEGGSNLDDHLVQADVPPLQYYVAAASFRLLGVGTVAGRLPFVLAGLVALWLLHRWTASYLGPRFPSWLPPLLLALNVPFLLYIGQCRYYALALMFTAALLWAWAGAERGARPLLSHLGGAVAMLGLFEADYMDAAAMAVACGVGLLHPSFRRRRSLIFLGVIGLALAAGVLHLLMSRGMLTQWSTRRGELPAIPRFAVLMGWQLQGLGSFEFFPLLPLPLLALPWLVRRLQHLRALTARALLCALMIPAVLVVIAAIGPQNPAITHVADMRYDLPVFIIGAVVTACAIDILLAFAGRVVAFAGVALILLSNVAYPGSPRLQCTLCERLHELIATHPSGTEAMLAAAGALPAGTSVVVSPDSMTLPLMFYRPDLRYIDVLDPSRNIVPRIRSTLPDWVFCCHETADAILLGKGSIDSPDDLPTNGHPYAIELGIDDDWVDQTRPELPWHSFRPDPTLDKSRGILVLSRVD